MATVTTERQSSPNPRRNPESPRRFEMFRNKVGATLGVVGVLGAVGAAGWGITKLTSQERDITKWTNENGQEYNPNHMDPNSPYEGKVTLEVEQSVAMDQADWKSFYSEYSQSERTQWAKNELNKANDPNRPGMTTLEAKWAEMAETYNKPGGHEYLKPLVAPSESMNGDEVCALHAVVANIINDTSDHDKKIKLLSALYPGVADPDSMGLLQKQINALNNGNDIAAGLCEVIVADGAKVESAWFKHTVAPNGYEPNGTPSKIMTIVGTTNEDVNFSQNIIVLQDGMPLIHSSYDDDSLMYEAYPEKIKDN